MTQNSEKFTNQVACIKFVFVWGLCIKVSNYSFISVFVFCVWIWLMLLSVRWPSSWQLFSVFSLSLTLSLSLCITGDLLTRLELRKGWCSGATAHRLCFILITFCAWGAVILSTQQHPALCSTRPDTTPQQVANHWQRLRESERGREKERERVDDRLMHSLGSCSRDMKAVCFE